MMEHSPAVESGTEVKENQSNTAENQQEPVVPSLSVTIPENDEEKPKEQLSPRTIQRMKKAEFLGNGPLLSTIWKMTYPDFIAKMFSALYNIIDSMFIGQYAGTTTEEKKNALAGVSLASPIEMCVIVGLSLIFAFCILYPIVKFIPNRGELERVTPI